MELIASRQDDWHLYKAGEQYFESKIKLDEEQLADDGEEMLMSSGNLKQLSFNRGSVKGWFNESATEDDYKEVVKALEPMIIKLWSEKKMVTWVMEIY